MKKIILLAFTALMMVGCEAEKDCNGHIVINTGDAINPRTEIIDSCEYIHWSYGLAHKGNCKFCAERDNVMIVHDTIYVAK